MIDGDDFSQLSDADRTRMRKSKIGFVFQKFNLLPTLDARSNIEIAHDIAGDTEFDRTHFDRITDLLGISKRLIHRPSELSGGEQQRVALARALMNKPALVLADEPTGNLDSKTSAVVLGMLRQSNRELGQTVLMITHNPEAAEYGDRSFTCVMARSFLPSKTRNGPDTTKNILPGRSPSRNADCRRHHWTANA